MDLAPRRVRGEDGTGLIASTSGIMVFLVLLLVAVQVLFNLYATSAVTAAAYDAARIVAGADAGAGGGGGAGSLDGARADAEAGARRTLGRYASRTSFQWDVTDPDVVQLHVVAQNPGFLPLALRRPLGFDRVDRTVRVRVERFQP